LRDEAVQVEATRTDHRQLTDQHQGSVWGSDGLGGGGKGEAGKEILTERQRNVRGSGSIEPDRRKLRSRSNTKEKACFCEV
jgi:hypothetical protein